jgi:hypothetical protein
MRLGIGGGRMIGVVASAADSRVVEEFFELFKTPWEPAVPNRHYQVLLATEAWRPNTFDAEIVLLYASAETDTDRDCAVGVTPLHGGSDVEVGGTRFPLYTGAAAFAGQATAPPILAVDGRAVAYQHRTPAGMVWRIGYDLFREVEFLLTEGQPPSQAPSPTLEMHIALLRRLLIASGVTFAEIPPCPDGSDFICCLTHDIDFFGIRRHKFDRTLAGFVARASVKTTADVIRGRLPVASAARNWTALLSLPLVFLNVIADFWHPFADYARVEAGPRSTFFLVPFKGRPGIAPDGTIAAARAVSYQIADVRDEARSAAAAGSELAVHGIDAWRDSTAGRAELRELTSVTGRETAGVRMHWLYLNRESPRHFEAAGFEYDSSWGYNEAVGYRAGTSQVFRLLESDDLMELPLSIMDSALFYPTRMGLSEQDAMQRCRAIIFHARQLGGTVVINWHDRSLAPERLWGDFYRQLLQEIESGDRVWFTTAGQAVRWFRWRRSFRFTAEPNSGRVTVHATSPALACPPARLRIHRPAVTPGSAVEEHRLDGRRPVELEL